MVVVAAVRVRNGLLAPRQRLQVQAHMVVLVEGQPKELAMVVVVVH